MLTQELRLVDIIDDICEGKAVFFQCVRQVKDIMTINVKTLTLDDTVKTCLDLMYSHKIRHVPVLNTDTESGVESPLVGVVSDRDLLRQVSPYIGKLGQEETDPEALARKLHFIVTRNPITVLPDTDLQNAIGIMLDNKVNMLPVVVRKQLVGVVTTFDIIKLFSLLNTIRKLYPKSHNEQMNNRLIDLLTTSSEKITVMISAMFSRITDIMTKSVVCLERTDTVDKAIELIKHERFRHIPVVDMQHKLIGIVSDREILSHLPMPQSLKQISSQLFRTRLFEIEPQHQCRRLTMGEIMNHQVQSIMKNCDFYEAVRILYSRKISSIPVVDDENRLCGIITESDVLRALQAAYLLVSKCTRAAAVTCGNYPAGM